jgi:hypothetical protein
MDLTNGSGVLKYSVTGCQKLRIKGNGLSEPVAFVRPAPMLSLCASCGGRIMTTPVIQTKEGQLETLVSPPDKDEVDDLPLPMGGKKVPENKKSGKKSPRHGA